MNWSKDVEVGGVMFICFSVDEYGWLDTCTCHKCLKIVMVK